MASAPSEVGSNTRSPARVNCRCTATATGTSDSSDAGTNPDPDGELEDTRAFLGEPVSMLLQDRRDRAPDDRGPGRASPLTRPRRGGGQGPQQHDLPDGQPAASRLAHGDENQDCRQR